jgi:hypothetical protein
LARPVERPDAIGVQRDEHRVYALALSRRTPRGGADGLRRSLRIDFLGRVGIKIRTTTPQDVDRQTQRATLGLKNRASLQTGGE